MKLAASLVLTIVSTLLCFSPALNAQPYPTRPITIIVPYPAGATSDATARILQPKLADALGQPIVIENRGGAGGVIGTALVARAQPDGYTLLLSVNAPVVMAAVLQKSYPFDPTKALAGISVVAENHLALVVRSESPIKTLADVVRLAKEKPGQITFGSAGVGSAHQIAGLLLNAKAGIEMNHVPFPGGTPAIQALLGGHIDMTFASLTAVIPLVKAGQIRLVALAEPKRAAAFPDLPTISETFPGVETTTWVGLLAPAGTPRDIRDRLAGILAKVLAMPDVNEKMLALGLIPLLKGPDEFDRLIAEDLKFWQAAVEIAKIEKQ